MRGNWAGAVDHSLAAMQLGVALLLSACQAFAAPPDRRAGDPRASPTVPVSTSGVAPAPTVTSEAPPATVALPDASTAFPKKDPRIELGAECDPSRSVASDGRALLVRDADVLARFSLERVLNQIIETAGATLSPLELLQRVFDTENATENRRFADVVHCDTSGNRAFTLAPAVDCPRAEGALAKSTGFFTPGDRDFFMPIALVNRFDLSPVDHASCGEYRIVYAKRSGLEDPEQRVFLILEGALPNPTGKLAACRPIAEFWVGLDALDQAEALADRLEAFFFTGLEGFAPVVHAEHYGAVPNETCTYSGRCGQLRLAQGMQEPWEFRQFRLSAAPAAREIDANALAFQPVTVSGSPRLRCSIPTIRRPGVSRFADRS